MVKNGLDLWRKTKLKIRFITGFLLANLKLVYFFAVTQDLIFSSNKFKGTGPSLST